MKIREINPENCTILQITQNWTNKLTARDEERGGSHSIWYHREILANCRSMYERERRRKRRGEREREKEENKETALSKFDPRTNTEADIP